MKDLLTIGMCFLCIFSLSQGLTPSYRSTAISLPTFLYVGGSGFGNYSSIQQAIQNASEGDTVFIYNLSSPYNESFIVNKYIRILGQDQATTMINGDYTTRVVTINADHVHLENLTICNSGEYPENAGLYSHADNILISHCSFYRTKSGIYFHNSMGNNVNSCTFHTNGEGIYLNNTRDTYVTSNIFSNNAFGIHTKDSIGITTKKCSIKNNGIGYYAQNASNLKITNNEICDNTQDQGGVFLYDCQSIDISNCLIDNNGFGIRCLRCSDESISSCTLTNNLFTAVEIHDHCENIAVSSSIIAHNYRNGIDISDAKNCKLLFNNIYNNTLYGVLSDESSCFSPMNWWGSFLGPQLLDVEIGYRDRISFDVKSLLVMPWKMRKIQHIGTTVEKTNEIIILSNKNILHPLPTLSGTDTDHDRCPDWWELKYGYDPNSWENHEKLDPDHDALNNIQECYTDNWDSHPFHKDIFLEIDWMQRNDNHSLNKPSSLFMQQLIDVFQQHNISLHVDTGNLGGGEEIPYITNFTYPELRDMYWEYFLDNDLNNPRKGIFHYSLICDYTEDLLPGFGFIGWDCLDAFDVSVEMIQTSFPDISREQLIAGIIIHELGHTLGLLIDDWGGIDNVGTVQQFTRQWWKYHNYKSCLNYQYVCEILDYSDGTHGKGDYNDWEKIDFNYFIENKIEYQ